MNTLFAYGTLMAPEVVAAVTGRRFPAEPASLSGYVRYRLRGCPYPSIRPRRNAVTTGVLLRHIGPGAWRRLDRYEGHSYRRITIVATTARGKRVPAQAYLMRTDKRIIRTYPSRRGGLDEAPHHQMPVTLRKIL